MKDRILTFAVCYSLILRVMHMGGEWQCLLSSELRQCGCSTGVVFRFARNTLDVCAIVGYHRGTPPVTHSTFAPQKAITEVRLRPLFPMDAKVLPCVKATAVRRLHHGTPAPRYARGSTLGRQGSVCALRRAQVAERVARHRAGQGERP